MAHINRTHLRSFSLNIFLMNSQELIEITQQVHDPDEGLRLMSEANREAGQQTHREINRRIHNFGVSALTLVEHTRIFMREHYADTAMSALYETKASEDFANDPVSQFVQKLRNYMVHKGLPNSEMFLEMQQDPASGKGATLNTGVRIKAESLLDWEGWGKVARGFIEASGEYLDIRSFTADYTKRVAGFHGWLQSELDKHHSAELTELRSLQAEFVAEEAKRIECSAAASPVQLPIERAQPESGSSKIADRSSALLDKIRKLELTATNGDQFETQRPPGATLTDADMIETPLAWLQDADGHRVFAFIMNEEGVFGFDDAVHAQLRPLVEDVLKLPWATDSISRSFIEKTTIKWLQGSFRQKNPSPLEAFLEREAKKVVKPLTLWAPIAHFELQAPISFGPVEVRPITPDMISALETKFTESQPNREADVKQFFARLRERMQGLGAIVIQMTGDPERLQEQGMDIAKVAVGLLRFISPAAANPALTSGVALLGMELVPAQHLLVLGEEGFNYTEGMLIAGSPAMRIPQSAFGSFKGAFDALGALIRPEGLSQFAFTVRASILLFTTGITFSDPLDRLTYSVAAMEKLLLQHSAEASKFNIAERMRLILSKIGDCEDSDVGQTAREAYRLLGRRDLSPLAPHQRDAALLFSLDAYHVLRVALNNAKHFETVPMFVASIEQIKRQEAI